jgi:hypothetical protein
MDEEVLTPTEDTTSQEIKAVTVSGYIFEITPQDGCISQCLVLDETQTPPENLDELAEAARKLREAGLTVQTGG